MNNYKKLIIVFSFVILFNLLSTAQAQEMVELKSSDQQYTSQHQEDISKYEYSLSAQERQQYIEERIAQRNQIDSQINTAIAEAMNALQKKRAEMEKNKFVIVSENEIDSQKWYFDNEDVFVSNLSAHAPIGFQSIDFSKTPLSREEYIGAFAIPEKDGYIHNIVHMFNHHKYGRIIIQEFSFETSNETTTYTISKPSDNIFINGLPAEYTVTIGEESERAVTLLHFYSFSVDYYVTIYNALMSKNDLIFLRELGESLL